MTENITMQESQLIKKDIAKYLRLHQEKELLRFTTAGSVDDGKSTLIGRLLFDTNAVYEDQLDSARKATKMEVGEDIDLSLLTDGLKAEREQGITIDVAYRYFTTAKRKFIIADTPGHVQYTRNMATGASTADVAIILIDARLGVQPQSKRHAMIASLLGIPKLLVAVNKMDLKNYSQKVFEEIKTDFQKIVSTMTFKEVAFFPVSALKGDNVAEKSKNMPWFKKGTVLNFLETTPLIRHTSQRDLFFPVQYVLRPDLNFRGYAGQIASGSVNVGDEVMVLPAGKVSRVKSIVTYDGKIKSASEPQSVVLTLTDEVDISRGDVLVHKNNHFRVSRQLKADVVWMNETPLKLKHPYWIKQASSLVTGSFTSVDQGLDINTLETISVTTLNLNDIGEVTLNLSRPLVFENYEKNRQAGAFIIIDRLTNATMGAGMVSSVLDNTILDENATMPMDQFLTSLIDERSSESEKADKIISYLQQRKFL